MRGYGKSQLAQDKIEERSIVVRHRHIHAKSGEWVHIHRDKGGKGEGCLGAIIVLIVLMSLFKGC